MRMVRLIKHLVAVAFHFAARQCPTLKKVLTRKQLMASRSPRLRRMLAWHLTLLLKKSCGNLVFFAKCRCKWKKYDQTKNQKLCYYLAIEKRRTKARRCTRLQIGWGPNGNRVRRVCFTSFFFPFCPLALLMLLKLLHDDGRMLYRRRTLRSLPLTSMCFFQACSFKSFLSGS